MFDALASLPKGVRGILLGSHATVVEPVASTLRALVEREHARTLIDHDPNVCLIAPQTHASVSTVQVEVIDTAGSGD